ncbi:hypothetical protein I4F81_009710 [Pyropia yezoensis]|uniref:Uncharacterized protein n=1 Tax=Pyropia yezoensis TaxID=2788 RepID=A0ACC3CAV3_PYRYE|nr:hypothetical protein I4F81_009710 [Neopyropia yezoensis]
MHCLKKTVAHVPPEEDEAYNTLRANLSRAKTDLQAAMSTLEKSDRAWRKVLTTAADFSTAVAKYQGDSPTLTTRLTETAEAMKKLGDQEAGGKSAPAPESTEAVLARRVKTWLSEVAAVESEYGKVSSSSREYQMYKKKVTALDKKKAKASGKVDDDKVGRNYEKLEKAKADHDGVLESVKTKMEKLWAVQGEMFEDLFISFWLRVENGLKGADDGMAVPRAYARERKSAVLGRAQSTSAVASIHAANGGGRQLASVPPPLP